MSLVKNLLDNPQFKMKFRIRNIISSYNMIIMLSKFIILPLALIFPIILFGVIFHHTSSSTEKIEPYKGVDKPLTRWWWFASKIDTNDIKYQLDWLAKNNFGGVEIAFVYPYGGDSTAERYKWLSKELSEVVSFAKIYANKKNLVCDYTFGTLWPFGDSMVSADDGSIQYGDTISPMSMRLTWEHPKRGRVIDHLNHKAFENYAKRIGAVLEPAMQGSVSALFCDSWEVETKNIWTKKFDVAFKERYNYDINNYMKEIYLPGNEDVYYDYMKLVSEFVINEFYSPYTQTSHKLGGFSRAQCGGSPTDLLTAFSTVDVPETEAILFEPNYAKIPVSAATLSSKNVVSSETFTCLYGWKKWPGPGPFQKEEQIADLKLVADALFAQGVNCIIWHGMPFNVKNGKNTFYASVHVGEDGKLANSFSSFNQYLEKITKYMKRGINYSDVAIYIPQEDAWMEVEYPDSLKFPWVWGKYEMRYIKTPEELRGRQPLWINNYFLQKAKFQNGRLIAGNASFSSLYIDVKFIDIEALRTIHQIAIEGFPICLVGNPTEPGKNKHQDYDKILAELKTLKNVTSNFSSIPLTKPLIEGEFITDYWCRVDGEKYYIFFPNPKSKDLKYPLLYGQSYNEETYVIPITFNIHNKQLDVELKFEPYQSLLLEIDASGDMNFIDITYQPSIPEVKR